ncbi:MAG: hypothetical protein GY870_19335 [archaeon]|nr:hypothetical protein [archaeon]
MNELARKIQETGEFKKTLEDYLSQTYLALIENEVETELCIDSYDEFCTFVYESQFTDA